MKCNISLKTPEKIWEAVMNFTKIIQQAAWYTTHSKKFYRKKVYNNRNRKIQEKRKTRKIWQTTKYLPDNI